MDNIRVIIVDDHKGIRQGLEQLIDNTPGFFIAGSYADCTDIVKKIERDRPDVVLMDIQMPGLSGIDGVKLIKDRFPEIRIVMQTVFDDDDKIFAAICAGASGYLLKKSTPVTYLEAIEEAFHGGAPMSPSIASRVLRLFREMGTPPTQQEQLSEREKEVLLHLVKGLSYKQIASACSITYDTVRFHMKNIYAKLHVGSMTEAVAKAIRQKLV
jgi:DNA-binding NarL/FixJ family response regulator